MQQLWHNITTNRFNTNNTRNRGNSNLNILAVLHHNIMVFNNNNNCRPTTVNNKIIFSQNSPQDSSRRDRLQELHSQELITTTQLPNSNNSLLSTITTPTTTLKIKFRIKQRCGVSSNIPAQVDQMLLQPKKPFLLRKLTLEPITVRKASTNLPQHNQTFLIRTRV